MVLISVAIKFALISFLLTGWLSSHIDYEGLEELRPNLSTRAAYCSRKVIRFRSFLAVACCAKRKIPYPRNEIANM